MQLQAIQKGRFTYLWEDNHSLIEQVILSCIKDRKIVDEGHKLLVQGEAVSSLYLVESGRVSMGVTARNGRVFQLGTLECESQLFGEMEFFTGYTCQMDIIALEAIEIAVIDGVLLQQALQLHPHLSLFFASAIAIDYQDTVEIFTRRMLYPIAYNIAYDIYHQHLNDLPVDGFGKHYLEAERFGTSDRVYRRAVKELENLGLISKQRHTIKIENLDALKKYVEQK
ncbi:Crp/Fnr family transcriptional regulator [Photobacterium profundum]|uniref:Cyclic nucleotide binding protein, putative n=1 Tax=Photobacterium profundum 3TCK TaxID=314280 RepID=Q1Z5W4_9GAMM|nr:Crp/Fnr family transcriptional regulator [Photobacterium profundum]EAS43768.1 cyclic nucleotide binding protein, putative [Photobacterium profundum 3TCK]PSV64525.1 Crp/Fnr family transcriptional regulator [Photobacterium profundum]